MFKIGTRLNVDGLEAHVIGYIVYRNRNDNNNDWTEYRLMTEEGEHWLSWDDVYQEYSLSWPSELESGNKVPAKWKKVDEGVQEVALCRGDVDVEVGDSCFFVEHEDETEEEVFSIEMWEGGAEVSEGYYLDKEEIQVLGHEEVKTRKNKVIDALLLLFFIMVGGYAVFEEYFDFDFDFSFGGSREVSLSSYVKSDEKKYEYVTSITGNEGNRANVYRYRDPKDPSATTSMVAVDLINGIYGETQAVSINEEDAGDESISILTENEYALIYYPEGERAVVYVQVSERKYAYTSDEQPYRSRSATHSWYRRHYYSSAYSVDAEKWRSIPSSYKTYDGPIVKDLGNSYFDTYSSSIRQSSVRMRNSDGGGLSHGK